MQVLSSKSSVRNRVSPLMVSALYLGSCNCGRHHPLCLQNHTAQSQLLLTLILQHWAEPPRLLSILHLVTTNSRVDKLIPAEMLLLRDPEASLDGTRYNPSSEFWVGSAWKTSQGRCPGGILIRCLNHLNWLIFTRRSSGST